MSQYFSSADRQNHIVTYCFAAVLEDWLEKGKCLNKDERKYLKTALTWLRKALLSLHERTEPEYKKRMLNQFKHSALYLRDTTVKKPDPGETVITISKEQFFDLCECAVEACVKCDGANRDNCTRYKLFLDTCVPTFTLETDNCPYCYTEKKNKLTDEVLTGQISLFD